MRRLVRWLGRPLASPGPDGPVDAIVVLGAPLRADGGLTPVLEERIRAGVALWRRGIAPILCFSGGRTRGAQVAEAAAMAAAARAEGVPDAALRVEAESGSTRANAEQVARLLRAEGRSRVLLVTQPFHLRRARMWFARCGLVARGWLIEDSLQFRDPVRALRWVARESSALARDLLSR
jgi:uncharacterized SAM-binding protein YcdF (DUF218 family)